MGSCTVGHLEKVRALASSGTLLVVGGVRAGRSSSLTFFDLAAKKVARVVEVPSHVLALAFAGGQVVAGCADGVLRTFDAGAGTPGPQVLAHPTGCLGLAAMSDGAQLASVGGDGHARLWALPGLVELKAWPLSKKPLTSVALGAGLLAVGGADGVVRVVTLATGACREMPGHAGPVRALAFTPRDGRLASAGDDGTVRLWFLDGAVEAEVRGANEQGHPGGALAITFGPTPPKDDATERLYSVGDDGQVKVWRLDERRKPKSFKASGALHAAALVAPTPGSRDESLGTLVAGGDGRALLFITIGADGQPRDATDTGEHGLTVLERQAGSSKRPGREAAARALAALDEPEALALLEKLLSNDREPEVRALVATLLGEHRRRDARPALATRLDDPQPKARLAAFAALVALEGDRPVGALKAGLASRFSDVRLQAVSRLPEQAPTSPLVPSLLQGALADSHAEVRVAALEGLARLHPPGSFEPYRIGFERGSPHLRVEAMVRALLLGEAQRLGVLWMTARGLDDETEDVRRLAFAVRVLTRPGLSQVLEGRSPAYQQAQLEVLRRVALARRTEAGKEVTDAELLEARRALGLAEGAPPALLSEGELEPLFLAMGCRAPDTALLGTLSMLALAEDPRAVGSLLQLSLNARADVRGQVAATLGRLASEQAEQRLVAMLEDPDAAVRAAAADAWAGRAKTRPLDFARALLSSAFEDLRVRGLSALMQGARSAPAEALLDRALGDESATVRAEAFRTLWAWERETPQVAVDRTLAARFSDLRLRAVDELAVLASVPRDDEAKAPASPPEWALVRLRAAVRDRDVEVALKAFVAVRRLAGAEHPQPVLLALASTLAGVREAGARSAAKVKHEVESVRSPLLKAVQDEALPVRLAALESLAVLFPTDNGPLTAGLSSDAYELKVRAAELLAARHDEVIIEPMRGLLLDGTLRQRLAPAFLEPLRARAASALATLGSGRTVALFSNPLLQDDNPSVREHAARGLCNASDLNATGALLDALGHVDVAVRSWAAEGLARNGDARGLPVLIGTLKDGHLPIREGAIRALVALGETGTSGLLAGLDDPDRRVQETFFAILLARDWAMARRHEPPSLLTAALTAKKPELRFAAARALELRTAAVPYSGYLVGVLSPPPPEKTAELKTWPAEAERDRLMLALASMLAAELPADRYAAGQALLLRRSPLEYFAEVRRITRLKGVDATVVPDTTPRAPLHTKVTGWLRGLFAEKTTGEVSAGAEQLRWLAFGAYVGILREAGEGDELALKVRRDCVDRLVALGQGGHPPAASAIPPLVRALDDGDHLVRRKALAGLKTLFGPEADDHALRFALTSASTDVACASLDELAGRGAVGVPLITSMLNASSAEVRRHAFELLVGLAPPASLEPLLAAFTSQHADLRLEVVERLATSSDARVVEALSRALQSEHEDLRLRAAELLADRLDERALPVLSAALRVEDERVSGRGLAALEKLRSPAAARALADRLGEVTSAALRRPLIAAVRHTGRLEGADALLALVPSDDVGLEAFEAGVALGHFWRPEEDEPEANRRRAEHTPRDGATLLRFFAAAVESKHPELRLAAVERLDVGDERELDGLLTALFSDRDEAVRVAAVEAYARRVELRGAEGAPLVTLLERGQRELMLGSAQGLAHLRHPAALRPLLLFARAGEAGERERALKALGTLGDRRALETLETVAGGGTPEAPADEAMRGAALEGLGRLSRHLTDAGERARVWERLEAVAADAGPLQSAGLRAIEAVGDGRAVARLERLALDEEADRGVRRQCVTALGKMGEVGAEATLARCLSDDDQAIRTQARRALDRLFPAAPMRVALLAADSPHPDIAAPAIATLIAEAEPASLLERLARPLEPSLRLALRLGLARRPTLPTEPLLRLADDASPAARDDVAWLMAVHALGTAGVPPGDRSSRARALAAAASKTAGRWARALGTERGAEARAWRRLLWAGVLNAASELEPAALAALAAEQAPATVRQEASRALARIGGSKAISALTAAAADDDPGVRASAIFGLAHVDLAQARGLVTTSTPLDALALRPAAGEKLLGSDAGRQVALAAVVAQRRSAELRRLTDAGETEAIKLAALAALGRIGGEDLVEFLAALAFSGGASGQRDEEQEEPGADAPKRLPATPRSQPWGNETLRQAAFRALKRAQRVTRRRRARPRWFSPGELDALAAGATHTATLATIELGVTSSPADEDDGGGGDGGEGGATSGGADSGEPRSEQRSAGRADPIEDARAVDPPPEGATSRTHEVDSDDTSEEREDDAEGAADEPPVVEPAVVEPKSPTIPPSAASVVHANDDAEAASGSAAPPPAAETGSFATGGDASNDDAEHTFTPRNDDAEARDAAGPSDAGPGPAGEAPAPPVADPPPGGPVTGTPPPAAPAAPTPPASPSKDEASSSPAGPPSGSSRAFLAPMAPSKALAAVVGAEPKPRTEAIRKLREYIQQNGLQDRTNRTVIIADATLRELFGKDSVTVFELSEVVDRHLSPVAPTSPATPSPGKDDE